MKRLICIIAIVSIGLVSCDDYLDINQDPNSPSVENVTSGMILPAAEMNLATSYGNFFRTVGGYYAQHYAHNFGTSNYLDYSKFIMSATRSSGTYTQLYNRTLNNLETVRTQSEANEEWGTYLAATVLRVFTYQVLVDAYGETPYTEALNIENLTPNYDDGVTVYNGILSELNYALKNVSSADVVGTNFLFGTSTVGEWIEFANALKFKILMRLSSTKDVKSSLDSLVSANNFPVADVAWDDCWADETGKASPYYQEEYATYFGSTQINVVANLAFMQTMISTGDERHTKYFEKNEAGKYTGGVSGTNFSTSTLYKSPYFCRPVFTYDMPVSLITVSEIEFFKAEYHARYGTSIMADSCYRTAINASFEAAGLTKEDAKDVYGKDKDFEWNSGDYQRLIGIQKWIALGGVNNFEAWCEMRRLKYPVFGTATGDEIYNETTDVYTPTLYVPGTLYTPIKYNTDLGPNTVLQRLRYAESSVNRNTNAPDTKKDNLPVFWAE